MKGVVCMSTERKMIEVTKQCMCCGASVPLKVYEEDYIEFTTTPRTQRRFVQDIFPYLAPQDREMFISQVCPNCWEDMFPSEDEDEDISAEDLKEWQDASCGLGSI